MILFHYMKHIAFIEFLRNCVRPFSVLPLLILLIISDLNAYAEADLVNVKTVGGNSVECIEAAPPPAESLQPLSLVLSHVDRQESLLISKFEIQFVACKPVDGKFLWSPIKALPKEFKQSFKDDIGQVQPETIMFEKYRILVTDKDGKILQTHALESNSKLKFKIKINSKDITKDSETKLKYVDVSLTAERIRQTPADRFFDEVNWGKYRIQLDSKK